MVREHVLCAMAAPLVVAGAAKVFSTWMIGARPRGSSLRISNLMALGHLVAAMLHSAERYQRAR